MQAMHEGMVIADRNTYRIDYMDDAVMELLETPGFVKGKGKLTDLFAHYDLEALLEEGEKGVYLDAAGKRQLYAFIRVLGRTCYIVIRDCTESIALEEENERLTLLYQGLKDVYEIYNRDSVYVADRYGTITYAGVDCEKHCGLTPDQIVGKTMYDLEREKISSPSITRRVLETKKPEMLLQESRVGLTLWTVGIPVFGENGEIDQVVSISKDFEKEVAIVKNIIDSVCDGKSSAVAPRPGETDIITQSERMLQLIRQVKGAAITNATVLLTGETGTGKTVIAKAIHQYSTRRDRPFVSINCGAIPEQLIESELFGYEKGAFTGADSRGKAGLFEMANGGTVFLDEIGELPMMQQVKLLSVLQERTVTRVGGSSPIKINVRIISATNKDLVKMVGEGTFREDLYYRLKVVRFQVPSLRERPEDIPLFVNRFVHQYNMENNTDIRVSRQAMERMERYGWPGNIRELENDVEMMCVTAARNTITLDSLPPEISGGAAADPLESIVIRNIVPLKDAVSSAERQLLRMAAAACGGNHQKIADLLGVERSTISKKLRLYDLH